MTARKRGRPPRNQGDKDRRQFSDALIREITPVIDFIVLWRRLQALPTEKGGLDRYQQALAEVAESHGVSRRTLERRYSSVKKDPYLGSLTHQIAEELLSGRPVRLIVEQMPKK